MLAAIFLTCAAILAGSPLAIAGPFQVRTPAACHQNETQARLCYAPSNDTLKRVSLDDLKFAAARIRAIGHQYRAGRLYTMNVGDTPDCDERDLLTRYTARIKVKHIDPVHNSSVLYEDIANTLDGGVNATDDQMGAVLSGCGANGGSMGVVVNATHPTYNSSYFAYQHAVTSGIIVKVIFGYSPDARVKP